MISGLGKNGSVRIIRARRRDRAAIAKLIRDSRIGEDSPDDIRHTQFWVALDDGTVVGCAGREFYGRTAVILTSCVVRRDYRNQGIGREFVRLRLAEARARGRTVAATCTMYYNFNRYKKSGFRVRRRAELPDSVREYPMFTAPRYMKCAVMTRRL